MLKNKSIFSLLAWIKFHRNLEQAIREVNEQNRDPEPDPNSEGNEQQNEPIVINYADLLNALQNNPAGQSEFLRMLLPEGDLFQLLLMQGSENGAIEDPDNMTYEQLLELGERLGKVVRGLSQEQIDVF